MTAVLTICAIVAALLLSFVTLIQMLYMDSLRLRTKEFPMLHVFRLEMDDRIGLKGEAGVLAFSLLKHSVLAVLGSLMLLLASWGEQISAITFLEAAMGSWATMMLFAYIVPQYLYRGTAGHWIGNFVPLVRVLVLIVRPLTALLAFLQSISELGKKESAKQETVSQEENIEALITAGTEEGIIEEEDRKLIHSVVAFEIKR